MTIGILISSDPKDDRSAGGSRLEQAAAERGVKTQRLYESLFTFQSDGTVLYEGSALACDALIYRPNFIEEPSLHGHVPALLRRAGYRVLNGTPRIHETKNKLAQRVRMQEAGLPMPPWAIVKRKEDALFVAKDLGFPVILKTPFGTHGVGVFYAESPEALQPIVDYLRVSDGNPSILESFVSDAGRKDVRVFTAGGRVIAAMERTAPEGDVRANAALGGTGKETILSVEEERIALECASTFDLDIAGVDLLRSSKGSLVIEVNANPGFAELERATGKDIAGAIIDEAVKMR